MKGSRPRFFCSVLNVGSSWRGVKYEVSLLQSEESDQHEDQNAPDAPTEVYSSDQTRQTNRAVYRLTPDWSLPDPPPDDRTDQLKLRFPPTRQAKANGQAGQARITLGRATRFRP
ncbi:hypothetical protein Bca52824_087112 [Brassica carinata]|uniref:Uncharacterized protein n=1 Tax=Brassica carinata TaxID=52824 RepID=A0A8X7TMW5_BRACI|nr:hypothetical protein Bca52824_087112 [Brassica carinata]